MNNSFHNLIKFLGTCAPRSYTHVAINYVGSLYSSLAEEVTESWGGHFEKFKIFLLQKLNSYGEP